MLGDVGDFKDNLLNSIGKKKAKARLWLSVYFICKKLLWDNKFHKNQKQQSQSIGQSLVFPPFPIFSWSYV